MTSTKHLNLLHNKVIITFTSRQGSLTIFFNWEVTPAFRSFATRLEAPGLLGKVRFTKPQAAAVRNWLFLFCKCLIIIGSVVLPSCGKSWCITASLWISFPDATLLSTYIPCIRKITMIHKATQTQMYLECPGRLTQHGSKEILSNPINP